MFDDGDDFFSRLSGAEYRKPNIEKWYTKGPSSYTMKPKNYMKNLKKYINTDDVEYKKENNQENKNMFDFNFGNAFNGMFAKLRNDQCRLTMNGGIAIKTANGYKTYNVAKRRLTNVNNFCFDAGEFFFAMPTAKVKVGDIILVDNKPKCVVKVNEDDIDVIDYETSEKRTIVPERHVFMGSTYFYAKIVSLLGGGKLNGKGIMGKIMNMMLMKSMMGNNGGTGGGMGGLGQIMMMQAMLGKGNGLFGEGFDFENIFDLNFGDDTEDEDYDEDEDEEPKPKKKKKTKKVEEDEDEED